MAQTVAVNRAGATALVVTVSSAVVLAPLNSTMIAVALTSIREDLNVSTGWASWLIATISSSWLWASPYPAVWAIWWGDESCS